MADLDKLAERYREAKVAYRKNKSDDNRVAYEKAGDALSSARVEQRRAEESEGLRRGLATVSNEEN